MFSISNNDISLTRGDTLFLTVNLTNSEGEPYVPQQGDTLRFAMKKKIASEQPIILKEIPINTMTFEFKPEDTKELSYGSYVYDIEVTDAHGHVTTVILGKFKITEEVY